MTEGMIGKSVRCIACNERFAADPEVKPPPPPPRRPPRPPDLPPDALPRQDEEELAPDGRPFCPGCGRRVNWEWTVCYNCGEPFDLAEDGRRRVRSQRNMPRRDCVPHRGPTVVTMGNITLAFGALSLCIFGLGVLVTVPLGVTTIVMATGDLGQMETGTMDRDGRTKTENGRTAAITGLVLGIVFSAGWGLFYWSHW
jgi:hypothetical protein